MNHYVARLAQGRSQESHAVFREGRSFSDQFAEGLINLVVDLRIKGEADMIRIWFAVRSKAVCRPGAYNLEFQAVYEEGEQSEPAALLADMAIENIDGINKGWMGRGVFSSFVSHQHREISPPFWWLTGRQSTDASIYRRQCVECGLNRGSTAGDEVFRYAASDTLIANIRNLGWSIHPAGLFLNSADDRFQVIDCLYGPF